MHVDVFHKIDNTQFFKKILKTCLQSSVSTTRSRFLLFPRVSNRYYVPSITPRCLLVIKCCTIGVCRHCSI